MNPDLWDLSPHHTAHRMQIRQRHAESRKRRPRRDWAWGIALTCAGWGFFVVAVLVTT